MGKIIDWILGKKKEEDVVEPVDESPDEDEESEEVYTPEPSEEPKVEEVKEVE